MASWALPKRAPSGGDESPNKSRKKDGDKKDGGHDDLLTSIAKLALNTAQRTRDIEGVLFIGFEVLTDSELVKAMAAAGKQYADAVADNPEHGRGPPHIHKWRAATEHLATIQLPADSDDDIKKAQNTLQRHTKHLDSLSLDEVTRMVGMCKTKSMHPKPGKPAGTRWLYHLNVTYGEDNSMTEFPPTVAVGRAIEKMMAKTYKAKLTAGPPPATFLEKKVSQAINKRGGQPAR